MTPATPDEADSVTPTSVARIRAAALRLFAAQGTTATSLRTVAAAAGVSVGLVQHHFATKAGLISAVDDYVVKMVASTITPPLPEPPDDSVPEVGRRVTALIAEHPDAVNYLIRALVDAQPVGTMLFDALANVGAARWERRTRHEQTRPDLDHLWAPLHPLILVLGTLILRPHIDRHIPEPFDTPAQMRRWELSVNALLREGQLRRADNAGPPEARSDPS